ncbi:MAG: sigma-54-dependent Fis family transcriptional regulator [Planctomyces sp.]|nr:sigma-54-dependent Fis family transcriptional regulator [Planctomyces sp.]
MNKPVIVVLSCDQQLAVELPSALQGRVDVRSCDSTEEVQDLLRSVTPQGFVADFRRPSNNGVAEARLLSLLKERFPALRIAMLTPDHCPESLQKRADETDLTHFKGRVDSQILAQTFRELADRQSAVEPAAPARRPLPSAPESRPAANRSHETPAGLVPPAAAPAPVVRSSASLAEDLAASANSISKRFETNSPQLQQMLADLEIAARHDVTIMLIGETGAGKTYLSRLIHDISPRRTEPFLPVACGALPNDIIESELFGHMKGSFTSAHADKEGKFIAARRGSLLLDEIDVLGLEQQVKLLRVIETGEFEPVGSNQTLRSQARLIVASNLELQPLVEQGRFRPDLYYRLNMLKFNIPPLRHRKVDIVPLARRFVRQFVQKHGVTIREIDPGLFEALLGYPWPGNVRELEHVIQRAVIYCRDGVLRAEHLPSHIVGGYAGPTNDPSVDLGHQFTPGATPNRSLEGQIAFTEKEIIEQALFKNSFSRTRTAKDLGISRVTLYNKMKRYGIGN